MRNETTFGLQENVSHHRVGHKLGNPSFSTILRKEKKKGFVWDFALRCLKCYSKIGTKRKAQIWNEYKESVMS